MSFPDKNCIFFCSGFLLCETKEEKRMGLSPKVVMMISAKKKKWKKGGRMGRKRREKMEKGRENGEERIQQHEQKTLSRCSFELFVVICFLVQKWAVSLFFFVLFFCSCACQKRKKRKNHKPSHTIINKVFLLVGIYCYVFMFLEKKN